MVVKLNRVLEGVLVAVGAPSGVQPVRGPLLEGEGRARKHCGHPRLSVGGVGLEGGH